MTIPLGIHCFCFITTLQERQQYLIRCVGGPNNIIWQKELSHSCVIERLWWLNRIVLESLRFGIGISIENWFIDRTSAWPETTTTYFVGICFYRHKTGHIWCTGVQRLSLIHISEPTRLRRISYA